MTYNVIIFISLYHKLICINANYVSVWDGGIEITTTCKYDIDTKVVSDIETSDVDGLDILEDEYVLLPDGTEIRDFINEDDYETFTNN